jgi:hypothetical protein
LVAKVARCLDGSTRTGNSKLRLIYTVNYYLDCSGETQLFP